MVPLDAGAVWNVLSGRPRARWGLLGGVVVCLVLASVAFLLGLPVGLDEFFGWTLLVLGLPVVAGVVRAGVLPTALSLWLVALWGSVFPPLVGYLTGAWAPAGRYTYPRLAGYAYVSARAELLGGLDRALGVGVGVAVLLGTVGYAVGWGMRSAATRSQTV
jgi:hypothetical protein